MAKLPVYMRIGSDGKHVQVDARGLARREFGRGLWRLRLSGVLIRAAGWVMRSNVELIEPGTSAPAVSPAAERPEDHEAVHPTAWNRSGTG